MPFSVQWVDAERSLMRCHIEAPWTWEEFDEAWRLFYEMGASAESRINCEVDAHSMGMLPSNALRMIKERYSFLPPNIRMMVVVNAPTRLKIIVEVLSLIRPETFDRYRFVPNFAEASRLLTTSA